MEITTEMLKAAEGSNTDDYYDAIVGAMNEHAVAYSLDSALRIAHFLAQIAHESGFRIIEENGNYSAKRMRQIFGCRGGSRNYVTARDDCKAGRQRGKLWTEESRYARNAKNLLSYTYASRLGNGDEASGDGFKYRGRGMIQLTGKDNYAQFTRAHNVKHPADRQDFVANPDLLVTERKYGIESAFFFWDARRINEIADTDDVEQVTLAVNGGTIGLADRSARLENIKQVLGI